MPDAKSKREKWLNYAIQPLARQFFGSILSVQLLAAKDWHIFFCLKPL